MKKRFLGILITILTLFSPIISNASVTTYERNENEHLGIWESIEITPYRKDIILKTPKVDEKEKVYDFADLFTDEEEVLLYNKITEYINNHNMDLVVVTTTDNNKASAKDYAYDFYDYNMFGKNKFHDGILFLIDMDTREIYFATSGEEQIMYDDKRIDDILDVVYSYVKDEKYYDSIEKGIDKAAEFASSGIPSSNEDVRLDENGKPYVVKIRKVNWLVSIAVGLVLSLTITFITISRYKKIKLATDAHGYLDKKGIVKGTFTDQFLTTHTTRTRIHTESSSGGGGSSGGSSISSGSSGVSHGGGGRSF